MFVYLPITKGRASAAFVKVLLVRDLSSSWPGPLRRCVCSGANCTTKVMNLRFDKEGATATVNLPCEEPWAFDQGNSR